MRRFSLCEGKISHGPTLGHDSSKGLTVSVSTWEPTCGSFATSLADSSLNPGDGNRAQPSLALGFLMMARRLAQLAPRALPVNDPSFIADHNIDRDEVDGARIRHVPNNSPEQRKLRLLYRLPSNCSKMGGERLDLLDSLIAPSEQRRAHSNPQHVRRLMSY